MKITTNTMLLLGRLEKEYQSSVRYVGMVLLLRAIFSKRSSWHHRTWEKGLEEAINTLTDREAKVIKMRFGLSRQKPMTLGEVGERFGVTRERVRQVEGKALRKLRHPSRSRVLLDESWQMAVVESRSIGRKLLIENSKKMRTSEDKRHIKELDLATKVHNALYRAGYLFIEELKEAKDGDFLIIRNIGNKSVQHIRQSLFRLDKK